MRFFAWGKQIWDYFRRELCSGYKFYFHLLGSTGCQLDVVCPRALTLSLENVQRSTINILLSWSQLLWLFHFFFLRSSCLIVSSSLSSWSSFLLTGISFHFFSYLIFLSLHIAASIFRYAARAQKGLPKKASLQILVCLRYQICLYSLIFAK